MRRQGDQATGESSHIKAAGRERAHFTGRDLGTSSSQETHTPTLQQLAGPQSTDDCLVRYLGVHKKSGRRRRDRASSTASKGAARFDQILVLVDMTITPICWHRFVYNSSEARWRKKRRSLDEANWLGGTVGALSGRQMHSTEFRSTLCDAHGCPSAAILVMLSHARQRVDEVSTDAPILVTISEPPRAMI